MKYSANISLDDPKGEVYKLFKDYQEKSDRSSIDIKQNSKKITIKITSIDSVALRASMNSITKLFTVYEKMNNL